MNKKHVTGQSYFRGLKTTRGLWSDVSPFEKILYERIAAVKNRYNSQLFSEKLTPAYHFYAKQSGLTHKEALQKWRVLPDKQKDVFRKQSRAAKELEYNKLQSQ